MTRTREENARDLMEEEAVREAMDVVYVDVGSSSAQGLDVHFVRVDPDLSPAQKAMAAKDRVRDIVYLSDDFPVAVYDAAGRKLEGEVSGSETIGIRTRSEYGGDLADTDVPAAVAEAISEQTVAPAPR